MAGWLALEQQEFEPSTVVEEAATATAQEQNKSSSKEVEKWAAKPVPEALFSARVPCSAKLIMTPSPRVASSG